MLMLLKPIEEALISMLKRKSSLKMTASKRRAELVTSRSCSSPRTGSSLHLLVTPPLKKGSLKSAETSHRCSRTSICCKTLAPQGWSCSGLPSQATHSTWRSMETSHKSALQYGWLSPRRERGGAMPARCLSLQISHQKGKP